MASRGRRTRGTWPKPDGKWFGRGTCDMKGFIALALAHAEAISKLPLKKPVHLRFHL